MTPNQLRVRGGHSLHDEEKPELCRNSCHGHWRTVSCDGEIDIIECARCGQQRKTRCNFDEEYS